VSDNLCKWTFLIIRASGNILSRLLSGFITTVMELFIFQDAPKTFHWGVIVTIRFLTYRGPHPNPIKQWSILFEHDIDCYDLSGESNLFQCVWQSRPSKGTGWPDFSSCVLPWHSLRLRQKDPCGLQDTASLLTWECKLYPSSRSGSEQMFRTSDPADYPPRAKNDESRSWPWNVVFVGNATRVSCESAWFGKHLRWWLLLLFLIISSSQNNWHTFVHQ